MNQTTLDNLKRAAKRLVRASPGTLTHTQALERLSYEAGFESYAALRRSLTRPTPPKQGEPHEQHHTPDRAAGL